MVRVLGEVLCEIQKTSRCKPKIVHMDKLVATRMPVNTDWVFKQPKRTKESSPFMVWDGLPHLFQEVTHPAVNTGEKQLVAVDIAPEPEGAKNTVETSGEQLVTEPTPMEVTGYLPLLCHRQGLQESLKGG